MPVISYQDTATCFSTRQLRCACTRNCLNRRTHHRAGTVPTSHATTNTPRRRSTIPTSKAHGRSWAATTFHTSTVNRNTDDQAMERTALHLGDSASSTRTSSPPAPSSAPRLPLLASSSAPAVDGAREAAAEWAFELAADKAGEPAARPSAAAVRSPPRSRVDPRMLHPRMQKK